MDNSDKYQTQNRRAIIDVGSNSVKLLVADVKGGVVTPLVHEGEQTRLGSGVFETGKLDTEAIAATAFVAGRFADKARKLGAVEVKAVATSAAREARNGMDLIEAFRDVNVPLTIIEGEREAELVLRGVRSHPDFAEGPLAIIDVGGGSTEVLIADESGLCVQRSFPIGTVRLLEQYPPSDLPTAAERAKVIGVLDAFLDEQVTPMLGTVTLPGTLVGAGGTPVFLSRILKGTDDLAAEELESTSFLLPELQTLTDRLWMMSLERRSSLVGLPENRADVILFGAAIFEAVMMRCGFHELRPTLRGVRYGVLLS